MVLLHNFSGLKELFSSMFIYKNVYSLEVSQWKIFVFNVFCVLFLQIVCIFRGKFWNSEVDITLCYFDLRCFHYCIFYRSRLDLFRKPVFKLIEICSTITTYGQYNFLCISVASIYFFCYLNYAFSYILMSYILLVCLISCLDVTIYK